MPSIDLNCDLGEGLGGALDAELMKFVSSVNIACGFHAGDATTMRETALMAIDRGVAIGAHPGYQDLEGFGRRDSSMAPAKVYDIVLYQVSALKEICEAVGGRLHHVKPHGALYNQAAKDKDLAAAIAEAVKQIDDDLILYGLSGSFLISEAESLDLRTASEVFADRTYQPDGSLTPRSDPHALINDASKATEQVLQMIESQTVTAVHGDTIPIKAETICIHGDGENALEFAKAIRQKLNENGIDVLPV